MDKELIESSIKDQYVNYLKKFNLKILSGLAGVPYVELLKIAKGEIDFSSKYFQTLEDYLVEYNKGILNEKSNGNTHV